MPTYVYKFAETGETIEVQQSFDDPALTEAVHPVTGATMAVKKVFLPVGITFKGDGFYKTDSRASKKSTASSGTKDSSNDGGGSSPSSSGGDSSSKPAAAASSSSPSSD